MNPGTEVRVARVYDPAGPDDGTRVLVDKLWPRGLAKDVAALDDWCREVAPSADLRTWYAHDPARFEQFTQRYLAELEEPGRAAALDKLAEIGRAGKLTLLTATKAVPISHATVLAGLLTNAS
ncbi:MAG: protein of unknown function YeaO [Amycolatopsis sp.]|jgi:uncharacterized protein YeaO (DUF488 family)|uniref:DUF488 domain-containing protein n=1 Tax=Amycolatopsis sp. TaxID=37632 RepID=UPI0026134E4F|nr:DUF488 family protein [Amycolatopsis sp.]MCU1681250.1 protein of unknown function YeaO [Amycolatopsis sp.]